MEYREAVAEARRLDQVIDQAEATAEDAKWARAELAWKQVQAGATGTQWAQDTDKHATVINEWVRMWERWGQGDRLDRPAFAAAWETLRGRSPEQTGMSHTEQKARQHIRNMPPEQKAEVVREALEDPEVAEYVVRDNHARAQISRSERKVDDERQTTAKERYELEYPQSVEIGDMIDLEHALSKARIAAEDALSAADRLDARGWPENSRERAAVLAQRAATAVELVQAKVGTSIDEELAALMEGER